MSEVILSDTAKFKITKIHNDIVEKYLQMHPEYKTKADAFRRAIGLLDEEMRKKRGEDDASLLKKEVKILIQSVNTMKHQMDVLIKLNMEIISRTGSDLSIEEMQQEVKTKIAAAVTKKSEGNFSRNSNRVPVESKNEDLVQQENEVQSKNKSSYAANKNLPLVKIEGSMENPIIKFKEVYSGSLDDWELSWSKGKQTYEKIYFKLAL